LRPLLGGEGKGGKKGREKKEKGGYGVRRGEAIGPKKGRRWVYVQEFVVLNVNVIMWFSEVYEQEQYDFYRIVSYLRPIPVS